MAEVRGAAIRGVGIPGAANIDAVAGHDGSYGVVHNGMSARHLAEVAWRKSRYSGAVGNCVELAALTEGGVAVRNSQDPDGPALIYTRDEIAAFLFGAKDGEFDDLIA